MRKAYLLGCAIIFFSLAATAGYQLTELIVPVPHALAGNAAPPPDVDGEKFSTVDRGSSLAVQKGERSYSTKIGFRKKLALRILSKRISMQRLLTETDLVAADKKARLSQNLGIWSLISLLAILLYPPLALISVSLGIAAIVTGSKAKKMGSQKKNGITMGIVALGIVALVGLSALFASLFFLA